jgi:hypothetical protein
MISANTAVPTKALVGTDQRTPAEPGGYGQAASTRCFPNRISRGSRRAAKRLMIDLRPLKAAEWKRNAGWSGLTSLLWLSKTYPL